MKKSYIFLSIFSLLLFSTLLLGTRKKIFSIEKTQTTNIYTFKVTDTPILKNISKLGINLNETPPFNTNLVINPSFEPSSSQKIVIVTNADKQSFSDEIGEGAPDSFWNGATYEVQTGPSYGHVGLISRSIYSSSDSFPQYFAMDPLPKIEAKNIILLRKTHLHDIPDFWYTNQNNLISIDSQQTPPESHSSQSLKITSTSTLPNIFTILPSTSMETSMTCLFWAKANKSGTQIEISLGNKENSHFLFKEPIDLSTEWQQFRVDFSGTSTDQQVFNIQSLNTNAIVWVDDLFIGKQDPQKNKTVVDIIKKFHPSYLRAKPELSSSLENWTSSENGKHLFWDFKTNTVSNHNFSLFDFLDLCEEVGANPWITLPISWTNSEYQKLGYILSKKANVKRFSNVIVELGFENWSWHNRSYTIPYPQEFGELADSAFEHLSWAAGKNTSLLKVVGGQRASPFDALTFLDKTTEADGLSISLYFLPKLDAGTADETIIEELFRNYSPGVDQIAEELYFKGKDLLVNALNINTLKGQAKSYERDRLVTSAIASTALAKKIIEAIRVGAEPIMIQNLAQESTKTLDIDGDVSLWGLIKGTDSQSRLRPTGLIVKMINHVIDGDAYLLTPIATTTKDHPVITSLAFKKDNNWSLVFVSESAEPTLIDVTIPDLQDDNRLPTQAYSLTFSSPFDANESEEKVTISKEQFMADNKSIKCYLPAYGVVILSTKNLD